MQSLMKCIYCGMDLDSDRYEFLKETNRAVVCMGCTIESPKMGLMDYGHKTAPQMVLLPNNPEVQRIALRAFHRAR